MEFTRAEEPEYDQKAGASDLFDEALARLQVFLPDLPTETSDRRNLQAASVIATMALFREARHAQEEATWRQRATHDELMEVMSRLTTEVGELKEAVRLLADRLG